MKQKQKPLSFSLHPDNIAYIEAAVLKQKEVNSRYSRSMYMDDLITHLRTKAAARPVTANIATVEKKPVKRFVPPALVDIHQYMISKGCLSVDEANKFNDFYESNGWKVGRNKMKCWKAAVRNWLKGNNNGSTKSTGQKLSANERVKARNDAKYRTPSNECGLGMGANDGHMGRAVDEGTGRATIEHVGNEPFVDY